MKMINDSIKKVTRKNLVVKRKSVKQRVVKKAALLGLPLVLAACGGDNDPATSDSDTAQSSTASYQISIVNVTNGQPLSPVAVLFHEAGWRGWEIGESASPSLEVLAESGDNSAFLQAPTGETVTAFTDGVIAPGQQVQMVVDLESDSLSQLTVASMLVNTNDAFTGFTGWSLEDLELGESYSQLVSIYDAGTELNDELSATIPGPAGGGEGYNEQRETRDSVTRHPGVVSQSDGYAESALDQSHRFDQGAMLLTIERLL